MTDSESQVERADRITENTYALTGFAGIGGLLIIKHMAGFEMAVLVGFAFVIAEVIHG